MCEPFKDAVQSNLCMCTMESPHNMNSSTKFQAFTKHDCINMADYFFVKAEISLFEYRNVNQYICLYHTEPHL